MPEKILIIDDDLDTLRLVGMMLQKQGYQIVAGSNGQQGLDLALAELPNLILLDVMMPQMDGYEVARHLRSNPKTVDIPILMFTAKSQLDDKVTGFEAGADDYLTKPTHPTELQAHVKALLARSTKSKLNPPTGPASEEAGYLIGIITARGGLGGSTIALNLASSIERNIKEDVILSDFRPGQGTLVDDLNLLKQKGLTELLNMPAKDISRAAVQERLSNHASGLKILCASAQPKDGVLQDNVQHFEIILSRLGFMAKFVVIDMGCGITPLTKKIAPVFNELILVTEPFLNPLNHTRALIEDLQGIGVEKAKIHVAVNYRLRSESQLSVPQVQDRLKFPIDITFTPAPELLLQAVRMQNTAIIVQPESLTTQQYTALANKVASRAPKPKTS